VKSEAHEKVAARHLKRDAYLYVRQSSLRQVVENQESTKRQYALRQRAVALGWPQERIVVIDSDQGQSGASAADREGFQRLVAEVGMGHAGIVMGLEVSRLARNSTDWHRLLEICALSDTLILDEDGLYDPAHFNDRLLLGLKGTMSEAELHVLRSRLRGGILNKARRAELQVRLPVGLVYDERGRVVLDPDNQVQESLRFLFKSFRRVGSAVGTVKAFREKGLRFPRRVWSGPNKGELVWGALFHSRVLQVLHHPRYAGVYTFGRTIARKDVDGRHSLRLRPREEWIAFVPGAHEGYLSVEEFEENLRLLRTNAASQGRDRRAGPAREGPALLQGLVVCGVCGQRMTLRYAQRKGELVPIYLCQVRSIRRGEPVCQSVPGAGIDKAVGDLLVETVNPVVLEVALCVQREFQTRLDEADALRAQQVERAQYETDLARRRFMKVDPENRLVADALEAEWNAQLRALNEAREQAEQQRQADRAVLDGEQRARVLSLATDFPRLWNDPRTPPRERKRMVRLLLEDVTIVKAETIAVHVRFRAGASKSLSLPVPLSAWKMRKTDPAVVAEVDRLLDQHTYAEIAELLHERGLKSGMKRRVTSKVIMRICRTYSLRSRYDRLREAGKLTLAEVAQRLSVTPATVKKWRAHGLLVGHLYDDKGACLYDVPGPSAPVARRGHPRLSLRAAASAQSAPTSAIRTPKGERHAAK